MTFRKSSIFKYTKVVTFVDLDDTSLQIPPKKPLDPNI
jgi:hypothetical protein